uniref:Reverse transcriptase domain-containing protein n=1 Tax=Cajanus cajan TaxID=3821 RepID=A0A151TP80_CAJCA|nr:hypothetical protein KK1_022487 [Cajanus cajan]
MVVVPKDDDHLIMIKNFGPILLCNMVYKLISKVLVNRLRPFLMIMKLDLEKANDRVAWQLLKQT